MKINNWSRIEKQGNTNNYGWPICSVNQKENWKPTSWNNPPSCSLLHFNDVKPPKRRKWDRMIDEKYSVEEADELKMLANIFEASKNLI